MNPQLYSRRRQPGAAPFLLLALFVTLCVVGVVSGTGQSDAKEEREVEDRIPAHLPVKFKVRNPEKAKNLKNEDWLRDIEIEVKNTGTKPIYFLDFFIHFVDVKRDSGDNIGYSFQYGRSKLVDVTRELPTPEDVPIEPGATHVFKLHEDYVKGWNWYRTRVEPKPHPKKVRIFFGTLSHGDGTGYVGTTGVFLSKKRASFERSRGAARQARRLPVGARLARRIRSLDSCSLSYRRAFRR